MGFPTKEEFLRWCENNRDDVGSVSLGEIYSFFSSSNDRVVEEKTLEELIEKAARVLKKRNFESNIGVVSLGNDFVPENVEDNIELEIPNFALVQNIYDGSWQAHIEYEPDVFEQQGTVASGMNPKEAVLNLLSLIQPKEDENNTTSHD